MAGALAVAVVATQSGIARYEDARMWVHMVQHALLGMAVPLLLVLSAPLTLALQAAGPETRHTLRTAVRSRPAHVVAHPLVAWCAVRRRAGGDLPDAAARAVRPQRRRAPAGARPRGRLGDAVPRRARRRRPAAGPSVARRPPAGPAGRGAVPRGRGPGAAVGGIAGRPRGLSPAVRPAHGRRPVLGDRRAVHPGGRRRHPPAVVGERAAGHGPRGRRPRPRRRPAQRR